MDATAVKKEAEEEEEIPPPSSQENKQKYVHDGKEAVMFQRQAILPTTDSLETNTVLTFALYLLQNILKPCE